MKHQGNGDRDCCGLMRGSEKLRIVRLATIILVSMGKQHPLESLRGSFSKKAPPNKFPIKESLDKGCLFSICLILVVPIAFENRVPNLNRYFLGSVANLRRRLCRFLVSVRMSRVGVSLCIVEWRGTKAGHLRAITTNQNCPQSCCSHRAV